MTRALLLALCLSLSTFASAQSPHTHQHSFSGAERWAHVFDDPARDTWQKPHEVIHALGLEPDAVVADLGSGTGYFSMRLANMMTRGCVYGVDVEPDMVKYLAERAKRGGRIAVIDFRMDSPEGPPKAARIAPQRVLEELTTAGYRLNTRHEFLPRQYFLVFESF